MAPAVLTKPVLTGEQARAIRLQLGRTLDSMARDLGFAGKYPAHQLDQIERGKNGRHLDFAKANLLLAIAGGYQPVRPNVSDAPAG